MLFPFLVLFKLKGGGIIVLQSQSGIEFLAYLFKDRRTTRTYQVMDIIFRENYATDFTKYVEATGFMPALSYLGINADTLLSAFWTAVDRIGLLL